MAVSPMVTVPSTRLASSKRGATLIATGINPSNFTSCAVVVFHTMSRGASMTMEAS